MSYRIMFTTCRKKRAAVTVRGDVDPYERFALYADYLLTGREIPVQFEGMDPDAHIDQVSLHWIDDLSTDADNDVLVTTVFLVCPCGANVEEKKRAQSPLLTQKQKLYLPKR